MDFQICDGTVDLWDGTDEINCFQWTCADGYQKCDDNLKCVTEDYICDKDKDCFDGSDEKGNLVVLTDLVVLDRSHCSKLQTTSINLRKIA